MSQGSSGPLAGIRFKAEQRLVRCPATRFLPLAAMTMNPKAVEALVVPSKAPKFGEVVTLDLGDGKLDLHIRRGRAGEPDVVIAHGYSATSDLNLGWFAQSFDGTNATAVDMRGHGRGGVRGTKETYDPDLYLEKCASDVAAAMDARGIKNAVVVGYSMGTAVASLLAKNNPERVAGLVLCMGAPVFKQPEVLIKPVEALHSQLGHLPRVLRRTMVPFAELGICKLNPILDQMARHDPLAMLTAGLAIDRYDSRSWFGDIECPIAAVISTKDQLVPYKDAKLFKQLNPAVKEYVVDTWAGHFAGAFPGEFPEVFRQALDDVLARSQVYRQGPGKGKLLGS